jgi:hypothetical protein
VRFGGCPLQFSDLIGQQIALILPLVSNEILQFVKLVGVESNGLWVESQAATNVLLQKAGAPTAPRTLVLFFPYAEIRLVLASTDAVSLDEKAFGL